MVQVETKVDEHGAKWLNIMRIGDFVIYILTIAGAVLCVLWIVGVW
jgi:hypothetical protein